MTLVNTCTFTPSIGAAVGFHGWTGPIDRLGTVVDRFRRPGSSVGPGYQTLGKDVEQSTIAAWSGLATEAACHALDAAMFTLRGKVCSCVRTGMTTRNCMVISTRVTKLVRTKGSADFRIEVELTVEGGA